MHGMRPTCPVVHVYWQEWLCQSSTSLELEIKCEQKPAQTRIWEWQGTFPRDTSCCRRGSSSNSKGKLLASFNSASTFSFWKHQNHPLALLNFLQLWPKLTNYHTAKSRWSFNLCLTSLFVNTYLSALQQSLPFQFGHREKQYLSWELRNVPSHD